MPFCKGYFRSAFPHWILSNGKRSLKLCFALRSGGSRLELSCPIEHFIQNRLLLSAVSNFCLFLLGSSAKSVAMGQPKSQLWWYQKANCDVMVTSLTKPNLTLKNAHRNCPLVNAIRESEPYPSFIPTNGNGVAFAKIDQFKLSFDNNTTNVLNVYCTMYVVRPIVKGWQPTTKQGSILVPNSRRGNCCRNCTGNEAVLLWPAQLRNKTRE